MDYRPSRRFNPRHVAIVVLLAAAGCGGAAPSGVDDDDTPGVFPFDESVDRYATGEISGRVARDELGEAAAAELTLLTPIGQATVGSDGAYVVQGFVNSATPALVVDGAGTVRSFGFVAPRGKVLDRARVARSLALLALKAAHLHAAIRANLWRNLGTAPEVQALASDLTALGVHLPGTEALRALTAMRIGALAQRLRTPVAIESGLRVTPADGRSGVEVLQQGLNEIVVVNHVRRRAHAFVERIGVTLADGTMQPRQDAITDMPVAAVTSPSSFNAALVDVATVLGDGNSAFSGNVAWVPTSTAPLRIELIPADARMTTYRVLLTGPGRPPKMKPQVSAAMEMMLVRLWGDTLALDVFLPLFQVTIGPLLGKHNAALEDMVAPERLAKAVTLLKDLAGLIYADATLLQQIEAGDVAGGLSTAINTVMSSNAFYEVRIAIMRELILAYAPNADEDVVGKFIGKVGSVLQAVDLTLQAADWAMIARAIAGSSSYDEFVVDVTRTRVKLSPPAARISVTGSEQFRATVPDATGAEAPLVTYRFKLTSGAPDVQLQNLTTKELGIELGSSSGEILVKSTNHKVTMAALEVEAILDGPGSDDKSLGHAYAVINVVNDKAVLQPGKSSIKPKATQTLSVRINNPSPDSQYLVAWSCTNQAGTIDRGADLTALQTATYRAGGKQGSDQVTVQVYQQTNSGPVRIGSSQATVLVEEAPTIFPATYSAVIHGLAAYAIVKFSTPAQGKWGYRLVGTGGYDPAYYGDSISLSSAARQNIEGIELGAGTLGWGLSLGSSANPAEYIPWLDARFKGFTFHVEGTRQ